MDYSELPAARGHESNLGFGEGCSNLAALQTCGDLTTVGGAMRTEAARAQAGSELRGRATLGQDCRGAVMLEYVVVLLLVAGVACGAIVMLGIAMAQFYAAQEAWIALPIP